MEFLHWALGLQQTKLVSAPLGMDSLLGSQRLNKLLVSNSEARSGKGPYPTGNRAVLQRANPSGRCKVAEGRETVAKRPVRKLLKQSKAAELEQRQQEWSGRVRPSEGFNDRCR